jgi:ABC-type antimicrobial peptide transport system permease subunit
VQSAYQPVDSLKNKTGGLTRGFTLRKTLVVSQFAISQILIVGTLVVANQMDYFQNQDLGFNKDAVVSMGLPDSAKREVFRQQLATNPGVKAISFSSGAPSYANNAAGWVAPDYGVTKDDVANVIFADENYIDMFGLKMLAGQKIRKIGPKDTTFNLVVNETLIHKMHIFDPAKAVGARFTINGQKVTIMGVVHDFQEESKHKARRSVVILYRPQNFFVASVRIQPTGMAKTISSIDKSWSALSPNDLFEYEFLDDHIAKFYVQEQKVYTAFKLFSGIAILIGCLGLYGLISFAASQRTREIGIRKVLGAPIASIVGLFSKEFVVLICIAFVIAAPVGYYAMHSWLQNYAYHIEIGTGIFVVAIAASFIIAGVTIAYQTIKAAMANPVKSLRSE